MSDHYHVTVDHSNVCNVDVVYSSGIGPQGPQGATGPQGPQGTWDTSSLKWVDLFPTQFFDGAGSASVLIQNVRDTPFRAAFMQHNQDDNVSYTYQMPHHWAFTPVDAHMHFIPHGTVGGDLVLTGYYCWTKYQTDPLPPLSGWTPFRTVITIQTANLYKEHAVAIVPPIARPNSSYNESSLLHIYWSRASSDPGDTFKSSNPSGTAAANVQLCSFDAHVQVYGPGSTIQYP